jgi:U3 small nucleolar RNA-associated protein 11
MALKDAVKKRTHKERSQPGARQRFGLLEKKKDYVLRARDFHKKESAIKTLRRKAEERNPDEFYFAMEKARTKDGIHIAPSAEANKYTQDELRLMKTQDVGYLTMKSQAERNKVERMKQSLHVLKRRGARQGEGRGGGPASGGEKQHTIFVDSDEDVETFDAAAHFDTPAELLDRAFNRPRTAQLASGSLVVSALPRGETLRKAASRAQKQAAKAYEELQQRQKRERALVRTREYLDFQKKAMSGGHKVKISEHGAARKEFRWKAERKR